MNSLIFLIILNFSLSLCGCAQTSIQFFKKSKKRYTLVSEKKATHKVTTSIDSSGNCTKSTELISTNELIDLQTRDKNNKPVGYWIFINEYGEKVKLYYDDVLIKGAFYSHLLDKDTSEFVPPKFNGTNSLYGKSIRYPKQAKASGIQGTVEILIKVESSGKAFRVSVFKSLDPMLDAEAFRIFENIGNFIPARKDGNSIDSYIVVPVIFRLE